MPTNRAERTRRARGNPSGRMWAAIAVLTIAVSAEGAAIVQLYGRVAPPYPPSPTMDSGGEVVPSPRDAQRDTLRIIREAWDTELELQMAARVIFQLDEIESVGGGRAPWLHEFYEEHGVGEQDRVTVNAVLSEYMMRVNTIRLQEARGAHTPKNSGRFYKVEHERMIRTLIIVLGSDLTAELEPLLDEHGLHKY